MYVKGESMQRSHDVITSDMACQIISSVVALCVSVMFVILNC